LNFQGVLLAYLVVLGWQAFNEWLKISKEKKDEIQVITQMLHNASLM